MKKIKENILIKNIFILLISGTLTKILGMFGKIIYTRQAGLKIVSLYTLITPTLMFIIGIAQFSFQITISKLSAENKYDNKVLLKNAFKISCIINIILIILINIFSKLLANCLKMPNLSIVIKSISLIVFPISISSIQRGFLHGKEDMLIPSISNITEEIIKIFLMFFVLPLSIKSNYILPVIFIILFNIITELTSIFLMNKRIKKKYLFISNKNKNNYEIKKDILSISIPTTLIRTISLLGFFLEPIILTNLLIKQGFTNDYIIREYGIINSYIIPLLSLPNFLCISISSALLPNITKLYSKNKYKEFDIKLFKLSLLSLLIGLICIIIILIFPKFLLNFIYGINDGVNYLYLIGPFFMFSYLQPTFAAAIQAMNKTNKLFKISIITITLKFICLLTFIKKGFGINSLLYSMIIGIISNILQEILIIIKKPD